MPYTFRGLTIPDYMMDGIRRYIDKHTMPGHFLCAVISNDLKEAVGRADEENVKILAAYVGYFYNEAPSACWGSAQALEYWVTLPERCRLWQLFERRFEEEKLPDDYLDELVHSAASQDGSNVNNGGLREQFNYLFDQWGPKGLARELKLCP